MYDRAPYRDETPIYRFNEPVNVSKDETLKIQANLFEDSCWFSLDKS